MLKELNSVEEMARLRNGTRILNRYWNGCEWKSIVFRVKVRHGIPHLIGKLGTSHPIRESEINGHDRYFVEVDDAG